MFISQDAVLLLLTITLLATTTRAKRSFPARADHEAWSCRDAPKDCSVLYHVFSPELAATTSGLRIDFWQAFVAATTVAASLPAPIPIVLATNYPLTLLRQAEELFDKRKHEITLQAPRPASELFVGQDNKENLEIALQTLRNRFMAGWRREWPFACYRVYSVETRYTLKAIAMNATMVANAPLSPTRSIRQGEGACQAPFKRTVFIDSDTFALGDVTPTLDSLATHDVAMVGEYRSFSAGAQYLYAALLRVPNKFSVYSVSGRKAKKTPDYQTTAIYEQQFNTGLMAYRTNAKVLHLMREWEAFHLTDAVCRNDRVAWDQCSLPWVLRRSAVRVAVLPAEYNYRQALGTGCEGPVYAFMTEPERVGDTGNVSAAVVVHNFVKSVTRQFLLTDVFSTPELQQAFIQT